ncbi:hypothetical protein D3C76_1488580 [compost metagenome]
MDRVRERNTEYIELIVSDSKKAAFLLSDQLNLTNFKVIDEHTLRVYDTRTAQNEMTKVLVVNDVMIESIHKKNSSLEDYFLSLLNGGELSA